MDHPALIRIRKRQERQRAIAAGQGWSGPLFGAVLAATRAANRHVHSSAPEGKEGNDRTTEA